ncbi:MAG: TIGR04325 family methyltransferase [Bacteroidota bacterium]
MLSFTQKVRMKLFGNPWGWKGNYATWAEAQQHASGYDDGKILNKVKDALLKVKAGEAVYERDSVLFDKVEYSWPLLSALMWIASQEQGKLHLIDFGGSLGSSYFQNKKFLEDLVDVKWNIVEQAKFVQCGKQYFETNQLKFYETIDACLQAGTVSSLISSSTIQYIEKPYEMLESMIQHRFKYIVFDLIPVWSKPNSIKVQTVPPMIYEASYPCWILNEHDFFKKFESAYTLMSSFETEHTIDVEGEILPYKGYIFKLK